MIVPNPKLKLLDQVREVMRLNLQKPWGFTELAEIMGAMLGTGPEIRRPKAEGGGETRIARVFHG